MTDQKEKLDALRAGLKNVSQTIRDKLPRRPVARFDLDDYDADEAYLAAEAWGCGKYGFDE